MLPATLSSPILRSRVYAMVAISTAIPFCSSPCSLRNLLLGLFKSVWRLPVEKLPKLRCRHSGWLDHVDSSHQWQITTTWGTSISRRIIYSFNHQIRSLKKDMYTDYGSLIPKYQIKLQHHRCHRVVGWIIPSTPGSQRSSDPAQLRNLGSTTDGLDFPEVITLTSAILPYPVCI